MSVCHIRFPLVFLAKRKKKERKKKVFEINLFCSLDLLLMTPFVQSKKIHEGEKM
jgi:hypothetical protein